MKNNELQKEYDEGYHAALNGKNAKENPYRKYPKNKQCQDWEDGFVNGVKFTLTQEER